MELIQRSLQERTLVDIMMDAAHKLSIAADVDGRETLLWIW
jgi:hypothetical protein